MSLLLENPLRSCKHSTIPAELVVCVGKALGEAYEATQSCRHAVLLDLPGGGFGTHVEGLLATWLLAIATDRRLVVVNPILRALYDPPRGLAASNGRWDMPDSLAFEQLRRRAAPAEFRHAASQQ